MAKGIIVLDKIPKNCRMIFTDENGCPCGGMVCRVTYNDVMEHVKNGTKPEWCPIKETGTNAYLRLFESKEIRTKTIKMVREIVGAAGMMDCKKALERNDWDITRAIEYLINRPLSPAIKRG